MALPATDAFTGADDASIGANWTNGANSFVIASNQAVGDNSSTDCYAYWNADTFAANQYSKAAVAGLTSGAQYKGVIARAAGSGGSFRCYICYTDGASGSGHTEIGKVTGGVFAALKAVATTFTAADILEIRCTGTSTTTIAMFKNGVQVDSTTDASSPHTSGAAGIHAFGQTQGLDNWEGGDLAGGGSSIAAIASVQSLNRLNN
jgi:hypothetical protein